MKNVGYSFKKTNQAGFSIVEVLISVGIMAIVMLSMSSMMVAQNKSIQQMETKLAILDIERYMITALASSSVCSFALTDPAPKVFNSEFVGTATIPLASIHSAADVSSPNIVSVGSPISTSSSVTVQAISVKDLQVLTTGPDDFRGYLEVSFNNSQGFQYKPLRFLINIKTNAASPITAKEIASCNAAESSASGGIQVFERAGYFVVPEGVTSVKVTVQGAGGGGGVSSGTRGAGGGGVATGVVSVTPHTQIYVQVGDGGAGQTWAISANSPATDGGVTAFGTYITCTGGVRGSSTGAGGTCTGGSSTTNGGDGTFTRASEGVGGSGQGLGAGAGGIKDVNGGAGGFPGGGGSGGGAPCDPSWILCAGAGAGGRVIIEW